MTAPTMTVRVTVLDAWDTLALAVDSAMTVADLRSRALQMARVPRDPEAYDVKFRGAAVRDAAQTLSALGVPDGGAMIVLPRRRRPVR